MSKIRVVTYRLDLYNLHTKIVSFADQEKSLKEVVLSLAVSMNTNRKSSNKTLPMSKICCDIKSQLVQCTDQKNI